MGDAGEEAGFQAVDFQKFLCLHIFELQVILQALAVQLITANTVDQCYRQQQVKRVHPSGSPPGRKDCDFQRGAGLVPNAVVVRSLDPQGITARRQVGESQRMAGAEMNPFFLCPFQLVRILILLRITEIQGGEIDREVAACIGEGDPVFIR